MRRGMALGKFMPPHQGHEFMLRFAQGMVDELTVLVCSLENDPIPGRLRYEWMRRHFGGVRVIHCAETLPQVPEDDPENFWQIWRNVVLSRMDAPPEFVFASESYGVRLARELGAQFVPIDPAREIVPVSASLIRDNPAQYANFMIPEARAHYVKRIVLVGPESSGKSTLTKWLAVKFGTAFLSEYGRTFQENVGRDLTLDDMLLIAELHRAAEDAAALHANGLLFVDTEAIITKAWAQVFFRAVPDGLERFITPDRYALYLLLEPHATDWHDDGWRLQPDRAVRMEFFHSIRAELEARNCPYVILSGEWEERQTQAEAAVRRLCHAGVGC